jgi:chromosome partitioning protein
MRQQARRYQDVVIDVGGRDSHTLRTAVQICDVVLVPVRPRSADVWALSDMAAVIDEVRATRERPLLAYAVLTSPIQGFRQPTERVPPRSLSFRSSP